MAKVIITGCGLSITADYQFWGDLWEEGDCWVFNACGSEEGLETPLAPRQRILHCFTDSYFQRRNVFVIAKPLAALNKPARDYISKEIV